MQYLKKQYLLPFMALLAILVYATGCNVYESPDFKYISGLRIGGISTDEIILEADAVFYNPNKMGVTVTDIEMQATLNGVTVNQVKQLENVKVTGREDFTVPLQISFPTKKLFNNFMSAISYAASNKKLDVQYDGFIRMKSLGIGFKVPVDYTGEINFNFDKKK